MVRLSPLTVHGLLPGTNCKKCGEVTCLAFASKLVARTAEVEACTPLFEEEQYAEKRQKLVELITPPVVGVKIGEGEKTVVVGGEEVLHRHELTFYHPCALAIDISDEMDEETVKKRAEWADKLKIVRIGKVLTLNLIAVRNVSDDPEKFAKVVSWVRESAGLPLILCSYNPEAIKVALDICGMDRPLVYAATENNWEEIAPLVKKYNVPVCVSAPDNLTLLKQLAVTLQAYGIRDIVLDPGTFIDVGGLNRTLQNFALLRRAGIEREEEEVGFPLLGIPAIAWANGEDSVSNAYTEAIVASMLIAKYADILILHSEEVWSLLPVFTLRQNIYSDPRIHPAIDPGLREVGNPSPESPVFVTSNFALTFHTLESDLEDGKIDSWVLVVDTEGIGVESAVAGRQFSAVKIKEAIGEFDLESKVSHRVMMLSGLASRISGETEEETGWKVIVGPKDSGNLKAMNLKELWEKKAQEE